MALADVYDALISKRAYKPPMPHKEALEIILEGKGKHFDPDIVMAFVELENTFRNIALTFADYDEERQMLGGAKGAKSERGSAIRDILLVEDSDINLEIMESQLTYFGYQVDTAVNGKDALDRYRKKPYDVVLTDIEMPEMDGYALTAEIRRLEKDAEEKTAIFAITASDFDLTEARAKALGFDGYMLKPLEIDVLEQKLAAFISEKLGGLRESNRGGETVSPE
jgi:putative two-component system response regulator